MGNGPKGATRFGRFKRFKEGCYTFMQAQVNYNENNAQMMRELNNQMGKITTSIGLLQQERGKFPTQPQANPQGQLLIAPSPTATSSTTLGESPKPTPEENGESPVQVSKEAETTPNPQVSPIPAPYPSRLRMSAHPSKNADILDVFKQVNVNIPLIDAIKQIPSYAKFLKDLCTQKCKLNVHKKVLLTKQVSQIIQTNLAPKFKDPRCPTIAITVRGKRVEQAPLDLGAMEDVLVQVDQFVYPVDFVVLDTCLSSSSPLSTPVILGRPFLATSDAIINCRNGLLNMSYGNMKMEVNMFNVGVQMGDDDDCQNVSLWTH
ncbi:uncharacterized protein LOC131327612 [Rhododendron vialii]|uniref:uncharacterized protein LOC131327612 n=1 Tax=Rhododendron vialii TaxID=182163 RepID=UPI00265EF2AB|nr:uncharacterized protein LOC131327612 [Rhododendron vialii]